MSKIEEIVIIGAGASGLCVAYELQKRGFSPLLLEQGESAGWAWKNMPQKIHLLSPWKRNRINGTRTTIKNMHYLHTCSEFAEYLHDYQKNFNLSIKTNFKVESIHRDKSGSFLLTSHNENLKSRIIINATGYFFNPNTPSHDFSRSNIQHMHVQQFRSASELSIAFPGCSRVLVVGGRISAGQTATELAQHGEFDVHISTRTPIKFSQEPWLQRLSFWGYYVYEDLLARFKPLGIEDTFPPMEAGDTKKLIEEGEIPVHPDIRDIKDNDVIFSNGVREAYDLIIYATGFNPVSQHLKSLVPTDLVSPEHVVNLESVHCNNLYFLGIDNLVNFRSRYLRGIREDAIKLATIIHNKEVKVL